MTTPALGILLGVGFGLVVGTVVAVGTGAIGFARRGDTTRRLPNAVVVGVALFLAGGYSVLIAGFAPSVELATVLDHPLTRSTGRAGGVGTEHAPLFGVFGVVVSLLGLYGHSQGERIAGDVPATDDRSTTSHRTLSPATVSAADDAGFVSIDVTRAGEATGSRSSLTPERWAAIESRTWEFPADLPIEELETRLAARLRTVFGVEIGSVSINRRAQATVAAQPASNGVASSVPDGRRAVTVETLVPAGLETGDHVTLVTDTTTLDGVVLAVSPDRNSPVPSARRHRWTNHDGSTSLSGRLNDTDASPLEHPGRTGASGERRVSVAVDVDAVSTVLTSRTVDLSVNGGSNQSRGAFRQLTRAGMVLRRVTVDESTRELLVEHADALEVLARRAPDASATDPDAWQFRSVERATQPNGPGDDTRAAWRTGDDESADRSDGPHQSSVDTPAQSVGTALRPGMEAFVIGVKPIVTRLAADDQRLSTEDGR